MGRIVRLEVSNFKSYKGDQVIGPFKDFTAVIGPNGAGKSNLMDAISFCVGVKTKHLRGEQMKDLIYNADGNAEEESRRASVSLVYQPSDSEISDMRGGEELVFTRTISSQGASGYRLQGKNVTWDEYNTRLKQIGVLVKARNFLVFQGDVESIASKDPKELTKFFEEISTSVEMVSEYERLKVEKDEAETDTIFTFRQKKGITMERRQAREQKEEAERFNRKNQELESLKKEFFLWQLFHIEREIEEHTKELREVEKDLAQVTHRENSTEVLIKEKKEAAAKAHREASKVEKTLRAKRSEVAKQEPISIKANEAVSHLKRKVRTCEQALEEAKNACEKREAEQQGLESDIAQLKKGEEKVKALMANAASSHEDDVQLTPAQLEELEQLRATSRTKSVAERAQLETIEREQNVDKERLDYLRKNFKLLEERRKDIESEQTGLMTRKSKMNEAIAQQEKRLEESREELKNQVKTNEENRKRRAQVQGNLEKARNMLRQAKAHHMESRREREMNECLENMMRHFEGVRGRLIDLCEPTQRRYEVAVSMALGRHMDAIVVDKSSTGLDCISYMRDQRIGVATFLPLDTLKPKRVNEHHRQLGPQYKLAVDVLKFDHSIEKAVHYALGGVVICENLDDARRLCFTRGEKVKAVTLEGHIISRNGDMTGGTSSDNALGAGSSNRFEKRELEQARKRRDDLERELEEIDRLLDADGGRVGRGGASSANRRSNMRHGSSIQDREMAVANAENRLKFAQMDLHNTTKKLDKVKTELTNVEKELERAQPEMDALLKHVEERQEKIEALESSIKEIEDSVFVEFGKRHGITDVREYEQRQLDAKRKLSENLTKLREQRGKMEAQLRYIKSRNLEAVLESAQKKLEHEHSKLEKKEKAAKSAVQQLEALREELDELEVKYHALKSTADDAQLEVEEATKARDQVVREKGAILKKVTVQETQIEKLRATRHETLRKAEVEQIELPRLGKRKRNSSRSGTVETEAEEEEEDVSMAESSTSVDPSSATRSSDDPSSLGFSRSESKYVKQDAAKTAKIDFSSLTDYLDIDSDREVDRIKKEYEQRLHGLADEIEKMQPNMKAQERYEDVSKRLKTTDSKLNQARQLSRQVEQSFDEIKQERCDRFMRMFKHVELNIDRVYKELTKSSRHPMGGNAYLTLENTEEPYLGGIKFNAMPPTKRFRDMDQLSGGEKTVAALALLFAIHSFHPAPFFVMDEIDAALDNVNVYKVSSYIRQNSSNFQCIVISLKDTFYDKADALVGIYREQRENCSRTATVDLGQYAD